jgi:hypothetical protein
MRIFVLIAYLFCALPVQAQTEKQIFYVYLPNFFDLPASVGAGRQVDLQTDNGTFIKLSRGFHVYPQQKGKIILRALVAGKEIWKEEYEALAVPPPSIYLGNAKGQEISIKNPLPLNINYKMVIRADSTFQKHLPRYANYRLFGVVVLYRGGSAIKKQNFEGNEPIDFQEMGARSGDGVQITIMSAQWAGFCHGELSVLQPYIGFFLK